MPHPEDAEAGIVRKDDPRGGWCRRTPATGRCRRSPAGPPPAVEDRRPPESPRLQTAGQGEALAHQHLVRAAGLDVAALAAGRCRSRWRSPAVPGSRSAAPPTGSSRPSTERETSDHHPGLHLPPHRGSPRWRGFQAEPAPAAGRRRPRRSGSGRSRSAASRSQGGEGGEVHDEHGRCPAATTRADGQGLALGVPEVAEAACGRGRAWRPRVR